MKTQTTARCFPSVACLLVSTVVTVAESFELSAPTDYQVVQRTSPARGSIPVAGKFPTPRNHPVHVEARLSGDSASNVWFPIATLPPGSSHFDVRIEAPAGGWYRLAVRVVSPSAETLHALVEHVGVGEVFVIAGQSNSANHGEERLETESGLVSSFTGTRWVLSKDPQPGATGNAGSFLPPFGDAIAGRFRVPVGLVAVGVGATSVREWLPRGAEFPNPPTLVPHVVQVAAGRWESRGTLFDSMTTRVAALGTLGFRAILWHQGESDANQRDPTRTLPGDLYAAYLSQLIDATAGRLGWAPPWFVAQVSYHTPDDPGSPDLRAAQRKLWTTGVALEGPDTDALAGDLRDNGGKGVHFSGKGQREHAAQWAAKVGPWLERKLSPSRTPGAATASPGATRPTASQVRPR